MKRERLLLWLLLLTILSCTSTQDIRSGTRFTMAVNTYTVGETRVSIKEQCRYPCHQQVLFVNLHDNEKTSIIAAEKYLDEIGGRLINIENNGERLVNFEHGGQSYSFDPNRIYSPAGIDSTITILSGNYDVTAANEVSKFAMS